MRQHYSEARDLIPVVRTLDERPILAPPTLVVIDADEKFGADSLTDLTEVKAQNDPGIHRKQ